MRAAVGLALLAGLLLGSPAQATSLRLCDRPLALSITQQDRLFRWAGIIKQTLDDSGERVAVVARSGTNLRRIGQRYSHAAISLKAHDDGPWTVRQLYFACDEGRPRLFDQGLSGFLLDMDEADTGYLTVITLPPAEADALERATLDKASALQFLHPVYSANAYAWGLDYQNCNQWVAELLAGAWATGDAPVTTRAQAQQWLREQAYTPSAIQVSAWLMWASVFVPWVHRSDHPPEALQQHTFHVTMPASIEAFIQQRLAGATRTEVCHSGTRVVIHRGWTAMAEGCEPGEGDQVLQLD